MPVLKARLKYLIFKNNIKAKNRINKKMMADIFMSAVILYFTVIILRDCCM